ncbi:transposase [Pseudonocardia sp. ICBG1142]|uniref:transposase n=1 Tax=Pseudonocardia sp. ICBG1142 TaxID=2846760 RepID=UPI001CF61794|nr:transposase [Pseudonocardia sp. ICBG1142]
MYYATGFRRDEIQDLAALVHEQDQRNATGLRRPWPPILGLFWSVVITLAYLRGNRVQWELAETYGVSQSTVSRAITGVTPLLAQALRSVVPTAEELRADRQYIIDGTLLPCWSWAAVPGLWSGKHRTTGVVVQVAATLEGQLSWISDPTPGSRHDLYCLDQSGALDHLATYPPIGDKGYIGRGMLTPFKKPPGRELLDWQKTFNKSLNHTRATIERVIAHIKTWKVLHTDYRRPYATFKTTISTVIGLIFYTLT